MAANGGRRGFIYKLPNVDADIGSGPPQNFVPSPPVPHPPCTGSTEGLQQMPVGELEPPPCTEAVKQELLQMNPSPFDATIPDTSRVAEMWLRLARLALLELPEIRHIQQRKEHQRLLQSRAAQELIDSADDDVANSAGKAMSYPDQDDPVLLTTADRATEAWIRLTMRIIMEPNPALEDHRNWSPRYRNGHPCLGDMMEESITWIEVDSEDDQHSPKHADQNQVKQPEPECEWEGDDNVHPAMQAIARQQRAPGVVLGMPKCLSF